MPTLTTMGQHATADHQHHASGRRNLVVLGLVLSLMASAGAAEATGAGQRERVQRGAYLANAGDCIACHTAPGGKPLAGGLSIHTQFGAITSPNITPDKATGIGGWTDEQFYRALHDGIGHRGELLYPVMPFPWYSAVTRDDVLAIRAWLATQPAVQQPRLPNKLSFPYNLQTALRAWRLAFFKPGTFKPDPAQSAEVNRGAYLVNGLAHCGECHNSRPVAGTSRWRLPLQGGAVDNWYAPNITSDPRDGIGQWSKTEIAAYLKTGIAPGKSVAAGPMAQVVHSLGQLTDADLLAIAAYLKTAPPKSEPQHQQMPLFNGPQARGGDVYLNRCASCHGQDGKGLAGVIPPLAGNGAVTATGPQNVISAVLGGLPARGSLAPMLAVGAGMSNQEVADVANFVRQNWGNAAPATAMPGMVAALRTSTDTLLNAAPKDGCPAVAEPALAQAITDNRGGLHDQLSGLDRANLPELPDFPLRIERLVAQARAAVPRASQADIVNGLTAAYCTVVRSDTALDWSQRAMRLGHFSQQAYMAASGHGFAPRAQATGSAAR